MTISDWPIGRRTATIVAAVNGIPYHALLRYCAWFARGGIFDRGRGFEKHGPFWSLTNEDEAILVKEYKREYGIKN